MQEEIMQDKLRGMMLGVAIGDALFMPAETMKREKIAERFGRITDYLPAPPDHRFLPNHEAGHWTDDTALTLAVADSLIACKGFNMDDLARRHVAALDEYGLMGFGISTREAIERLRQGVHWSKSGAIPAKGKLLGKGNGIPMKIAPLATCMMSPKWRGNKIDALIAFAFMTHRSAIAAVAGGAHARGLMGCLEAPQIPLRSHGGVYGYIDVIDFMMERIYRSMHDSRETQEILSLRYAMRHHGVVDYTQWNVDVFTATKIYMHNGGGCYVGDSLPFSYAFFVRNPDSIETLYDVGNAGGDTDTNASMVGALLGALHGTAIFPPHLVEGLWQRDRIIRAADQLFEIFWN